MNPGLMLVAWSLFQSPIPADVQPHLDRALALGKAIYAQDVLSAWGTDVLRKNVPSLAGVGGYFTLQETSADGTKKPSWLVQFFTADGVSPRILYRIRLWPKKEHQPVFEKVNPPAAPSAAELAIIKARQAALKALPATTQPINPVVLPGALIGERGTLVYLLAGTNKRGVVVLGKHHRAHIAEDGTVAKLQPLSKGILEIQPPPPTATGVGVAASHILDDWPIETHVFASLLHRVPIFVATARGDWEVTGKQITLVRLRTAATNPGPPPAKVK
jgi:hypothetical protein